MTPAEELKEYENILADRLTAKGVDLAALAAFVEQMGAQLSVYAGLDVEEPAPTLAAGSFNPGGWVGNYYLGEGSTRLKVSPSKFDGREFDSLRKDVVGWLEFAGAPFVESFFEFYTSELLDKSTLYSSYSSFLMQLTESLVGLRPPRSIIVSDYVGPELRGKPRWGETVLLQSKDPSLYASTRSDFTFRTALNLLLAKFHAELAAGLQSVAERVTVQPLKDSVSKKREYHSAFVDTVPWRDLLDEAVRFDPFDPLNARRLDMEAATHRIYAIVDLWVAYAGRRSSWLRMGQRFDAALKPMSKVYELWAFKTLADALSEHLQADFDPPSEFPCAISFGKAGGAKLYYNGGPKGDTIFRHGQVLKEFHTKGIAPTGLRPDFLVTLSRSGSEQVLFLADAKYRRPEDLARDSEVWAKILAYVEEYTPPKPRSEGKRTPFVVLHVGEEGTAAYDAGGVVVHLVALRPKTLQASKDYLKREVFQALGLQPTQ